MPCPQALYAFPAGATNGIYLQKSAMGGSYSISSIARKLSLKPSTAKSERKLVDDEDKQNKTDDEEVEAESDEDKKEVKAGNDEKEVDKEKVEAENDEKEVDKEKVEAENDEKEEDKEKGEAEKEEDNEEKKDEDNEDETTTTSLGEKSDKSVLEQKIVNPVDEKGTDDEEVVKEDEKTVGGDTQKTETTSSLAAEGKAAKDPVATVKADISKEEKDEEQKDDDEDIEEEKDDEKHKEKEDEDDNKLIHDGEALVAYRAIAARQALGSNSLAQDLSSKHEGLVHGAGALRATTQERSMDKYAALIERRQKMLKAKGLAGNLLGRLGAVRHRRAVGPGGTVVLSTPGKSGDTTVMRANKPGTSEFEQRKKEILDRIKKDKSRRGHSPLLGAKAQSTVVTELVNKLHLPFKKEPKPAGIVRKTFESVPVVKTIFKMTPEEELILDVSLSFVTGLKHGVFMSSGPLNEDKKEALKAWLDLLSIGLPPEWGLHILIDALSRQIDFISENDENLSLVLNKFPLSRKQWSKGCRKYDGSAGFSCGMWKLLHVVTVGVAEHRGGLNLVQSGLMNPDTVVFAPAAAADAIRDYMQNFFGCDECRQHFLSRYDDCSFRRCDRLSEDGSSASSDDWKQVALWMWEVHNDVNVRVGNKKVERLQKKLSSKHLQGAQQLKIVRKEEDEIRVIWPSLENCLVCLDDGGKWNEDSVFEFLERTYWDAPNAKFDRLLTHRNVEGEDVSGGGFIWIMMIIAVAIVLLVRQHVNNLSFQTRLRKFNVPSVIGVKNKIEDAVAGKHRTA